MYPGEAHVACASHLSTAKQTSKCAHDIQELHAQQLEAGEQKQADGEDANAEVQRLQAQLLRQQRQTEQVCTTCLYVPALSV